MADRRKPIMDDDDWNRTRVRLDAAHSKIESAVDELLSLAESLIGDTEVDYAVQAYCYLAEVSAADLARGRIWNWLRERAKSVKDPNERSAMCCAFFGPTTEDPVDFLDIGRLCRFLNDPDSAWATFCGYEDGDDFPANLRQHLDALRRRSARGILSDEQFDALLKRYRQSGESALM